MLKLLMKRASALAVALLAGCTSLEFYAPEVGADWSSEPVVRTSTEASVAGVTVKKVGEEYSPVTSVGTLTAPAYAGGRQETWAVEGPDGFRATIHLIQSDLVLSGPVQSNVLNADTIDFSKGRQVVKVTQESGSALSEPGAISSPPVFQVSGLGVAATSQGQSGGKVSDYQSWGLTTGLRLTKNGALVGYLSLTNGTTLKKSSGASVDPLLVALAMVSAQQHFEFRTPPQKVVPEVIDVFGLTFTSEVSHN